MTDHRLLVTVKQARAILGDMGNNRFWTLVKAGDFVLVGTARKRFVVVKSLNQYVERQIAAAKAKPDRGRLGPHAKAAARRAAEAAAPPD